jgi:hypothetical protein
MQSSRVQSLRRTQESEGGSVISVEVLLLYGDQIRMYVPAPDLPHGTMNENVAVEVAERVFTEGTHHQGTVVGARCSAPSGYVFYAVGDVS